MRLTAARSLGRAVRGRVPPGAAPRWSVTQAGPVFITPAVSCESERYLNSRSFTAPTASRAFQILNSRHLTRALSCPAHRPPVPASSMAAADRDVLPDIIKPVNYAISLYDLELGGDFGYKGTVKIDVVVKQNTKQLVLNTNQIKIFDAEVAVEASKTESTIKSTNVSYDEKRQIATVDFDAEIPASNKGLITINFSGVMNNNMNGFYRSKYKPKVPPVPSVAKDDEFHYMFSTQFESSDARKAFPCFDEPNLKASFDFEIEIPEDQVALSNQPEKEVRKGSKDGLKIVSFERTPIMSTYLLAWAFGDFEYVEYFTDRKYGGKNLPVRVYTTKGLKEQGRFAGQNATKVLDYFSELFGIDYPLPKSDLLAVHEFSHGAMENWGLVTYRTTAVLYDEKNSDSRFRNRVAYVVAHELAHQWFGNLVTMDWWSELWLNEGFATWVGWLAIDHLYPEWEIWGQFVTEAVGMAFKLDSIRGSHPIEVPVKNALEIEQIFDHISYLKGSSVIRMLASYLGTDTFIKGVSNYLKKHAYGNATTEDLWSALSEASGKDVSHFMNDWIKKIGFPVVTVAEEPGQITLKQSRFLSTGDVKAEEDETVWWIPLGLKTNPKASTAEEAAKTLTTKEDTLRNLSTDFYMLNANQYGFYCVNYPAERLAKLGAVSQQLTLEDKVALIGDAVILAVNGQGSSAGFLALVESFKNETNKIVWDQIISSLARIQSTLSTNEQIRNGFKKFTLELISPAVEKVGWTVADNEDYLTTQLRSLLIKAAGGAGHQKVIDESRRLFKEYFAGNKDAIHASLRSAVFTNVIRVGGKEEYDLVKKEYSTNESVDAKDICAAALGRVSGAELINDFIDFVFSDTVALQDKNVCAAALAANVEGRYILWDYIKANWDTVRAKLSKNMVVMDRFLRLALVQFSDMKYEQEIAAFFKDKDNTGYDRSIAVVSDSITTNSNYKARDEAIVAEWLKTHGYSA